MKTILAILSLIIINSQLSTLNSIMWEVRQDGNGDFISIQAAMNRAVDGDSILVHPGRYIGTVDYLGKSISLFSLAITTGNSEYVEQTIIDAQRFGSAVSIINSNNAYIGGFTITGGSGRIVLGRYYQGGGLAIYRSSAVVENCLVVDNRAEFGGGVCVLEAQVFFRGNTITGNNASSGGGIDLYIPVIADDNLYIFCPEIKNNIYLNNAAQGHEINGTRVPDQIIRLGKANILHQEPYHYDFYWHGGNITVSADSAMIERVDSDLYVATWGDNTNSGLTPDEPLKSIAFALLKINADHLSPLNTRTIYIEEGTYSPSTTGEKLPLHLRSYITLTSLNEDTKWTIDAEGLTSYGASIRETGDITVRNGVFRRGSQFGHVNAFVGSTVGSIFFENLEFYDAKPHHLRDRLTFFGSGQSKFSSFRNISIHGNPWGHAVSVQINSSVDSKAVLDRMFVNDVRGKGIKLSLDYGERIKDITLSNSIVTNSALISPNLWTVSSALGIFGSGRDIPVDRRKVRVINNTFADNSYNTDLSAAIYVSYTITAEFYNNIVYGNNPRTILLDGVSNGHHFHGDIYLSHNLFERGVADIEVRGRNYIVRYDNILSGNPMFLGEGEHPYQLSEGSPANYAGTTNIPGYTFEEFDLAGNPRIVDGRISLGAYQWQKRERERRRTAGLERDTKDEFNLRSYPNPVSLNKRKGSSMCNIKFTMPETADVVIAVYNSKGQRVKTLLTGLLGEGNHHLRWDGTNNRGEQVGTGMYIYKIETETLESSGQIMVVK